MSLSHIISATEAHQYDKGHTDHLLKEKEVLLPDTFECKTNMLFSLKH